MSAAPIILIVDDVVANRETLTELLSSGNYTLVEATNGPQALACAAATPPDLILLDVMMPGMDGYEVCRRLRADPGLAEVPIVLITALDDQTSRITGIEAGADDFISKPFNSAELRARVHTITRLNRYRRLLKAQTELHESERKFLSVFQNAAVGLAISESASHRILDANPRLCEMLGYTVAELVQMTTRDITHPDKIEQELARGAQLSGRPIRESSQEKRYRKKDGSCVWTKVFTAALDPLGVNDTRMIEVIEDITAQKQAETDLREGEERSEHITTRTVPLLLWGVALTVAVDLASGFGCVAGPALNVPLDGNGSPACVFPGQLPQSISHDRTDFRRPKSDDVQLDTALDDTRTDRIAGETGDVMNVELVHQLLPMLLHCLDADAEFRRNLFVA